MVSVLLCYFRCDPVFSSVLSSPASTQRLKFCHCLNCSFRQNISPQFRVGYYVNAVKKQASH